MGEFRPAVSKATAELKLLQDYVYTKEGRWEAGETVSKSAEPPDTPPENQLWIDTSYEPNRWYRWDAEEERWVKVTPTEAIDIMAEREVYRGELPPGEPQFGDLWIDTSVSPPVWNFWNDLEWQPITRTAFEQLEGTVQELQIADRAVTEAKLALGAVTEDILAASAVTETKIADNAISTPKLQAGAITTGKLAAGSVTAEKIAAGAVTSEKIYAGAVTADKINVSNLSAISANLGTVTAGELGANVIFAGELVAATGTFEGDLTAQHSKIGDPTKSGSSMVIVFSGGHVTFWADNAFSSGRLVIGRGIGAGYFPEFLLSEIRLNAEDVVTEGDFHTSDIYATSLNLTGHAYIGGLLGFGNDLNGVSIDPSDNIARWRRTPQDYLYQSSVDFRIYYSGDTKFMVDSNGNITAYGDTDLSSGKTKLVVENQNNSPPQIGGAIRYNTGTGRLEAWSPGAGAWKTLDWS
ncbi:MAG: hypothetical protein JRC90_11170 [Deltaproteobacteria bacterium]|nr:hypothetical protein [Deltaproteobacteria bacterium]